VLDPSDPRDATVDQEVHLLDTLGRMLGFSGQPRGRVVWPSSR
jgi:hypothetical protein